MDWHPGDAQRRLGRKSIESSGGMTRELERDDWDDFLLGLGVVRCGVTRCGVVRCGVTRCGVVRCGVVRCGVTRCGVTRLGVVGRVEVRGGVVVCGMLRGDEG